MKIIITMKSEGLRVVPFPEPSS